MKTNAIEKDQEVKEQQPKRYQIEDKQGLVWTFQKAEQVRQEIAGKKKMMEKSIEFYQQQIKDLQAELDNFKSIAMQYAQEQIDEDPNWEFKDSPFGRIVQSKPSTSLQVADEQALVNRYKGTEFVKHVEEDKLRWGDLKKTLSSPDGEHVVNSDGELVDDIKVVTKPSKIEIKHKNEKGSWVTKED